MVSFIQLDDFARAAKSAFSSAPNDHLVFTGTCIQRIDKVLHASMPSAAQENMQTVLRFKNCLNEVLGPEKVDRICRRYRFNLDKHYREGLPLLPRHIELFSIGASRMLSRDLKTNPVDRLRYLTTSQLKARLDLKNPLPFIGEVIDPGTIMGTPTNICAWFFHDKKLMDKETQLLFSDIGRMNFPAWLERFAKCTVNRELAEKQVIPAPGLHGRIEYYKVYRKIATGHGLVAYALKPLGADSSLKPQLIFRPTQFAPSNEDAFSTYLNNLQFRMGELGYSHAKPLLDALMRDSKFCPPGTRINTAGFSLGGLHEQWFYVDHWSQIADAIFYSDPSLPPELAENFATMVNALPRLNQEYKITIYRSKYGQEGDLAYLVGGKHAGWGVTHPDFTVQIQEYDHSTKEVIKIGINDRLRLHGSRIHDNAHPDYKIKTVNDRKTLDDLLNNDRPEDPTFWYEQMRRFWGGISYWIVFAFREIFKVIFAIIGIKAIRSSQDQDASN